MAGVWGNGAAGRGGWADVGGGAVGGVGNGRFPLSSAPVFCHCRPIVVSLCGWQHSTRLF